MPYGSNRIIRFCGWWLDFFGTKLYMWAISYCHFWYCILFFSVHLSSDSGENLHFFRLVFFCCSIQRFYTNSYKWNSSVWFLYEFIQYNSYNCYTNCIVGIRTRCGFCTNSYIFYMNCIVRIHTRWPNKLFGNTKRILSLFYTNSYLEFV